ncbi:MAG TPA: low affinity iron permease family protein [Methylovirgula sp.]|nr:low affinity iron permease family protein [Methylovirgula sp.]
MKKAFAKFAGWSAHLAGHPAAFGASVLLILIWAGAGPLFHYSDSWQLVANTATNLITFVMVFVIQSSQNRDAAAIQAKLDALIRAGNAEERFAGIDQLTEDEVNELRAKCAERARAETGRRQRAQT